MNEYCWLKIVWIFLIAAAILASGWFQQEARSEVIFPHASWEHREPSELGLNKADLEQLAISLGGRGCVIKDGYVVITWGDQAEKGDWLSSAKPVLSTLLFFAIHEDLVKSVDQPISDFGWDLKPKDQQITFRHLGSMTSGYARPEPPGTAWAYNDFAIQLYQKTLFDRVFKGSPEEASMDPKRFGALQLEDGLSFTKSNRRLIASVQDFARITWFWLNRGKWRDTQLLPRRFFDDYMKPQTPKHLPHTAEADTDDYLEIGSYGGGSDHFTEFGAGIYGFNWWFNDTGRLHPDSLTWPDAPKDTVMSIGAGGNCAALIPSENLILVCAQGNWGELKAGEPGSKMNQHLKLLIKAAEHP
jgi:CubicO group peptidase (beta-lactamase class C family)